MSEDQARKVIQTFKYEPKRLEKGYSDRTLYVNLSDNTVKAKTISKETKDVFIGGRGYGLYYLWQAVTGLTKWNDPENEIIISCGPIAGITQYPGTGKSIVVTLSPTTGTVIDSNVGGYFGPFMKFSGWDALEVQGKAEHDVVVYIDGDKGVVTIEEVPLGDLNTHVLAERLTDYYSESEDDKKNISVVSTGTGADKSLMGMLNFSFYDRKRKAVRIKQAGRGGIGTVFRDKNIAAFVIKFSNVKGDLNNPADKKRIDDTGIKMHKEVASMDPKQNNMRKRGTTMLTPIANDNDLLPVFNFKYGSHPDAKNIETWVDKFCHTGTDGCWYGCTVGCAKVVSDFELRTGPYKGQKVTVDGPEYETIGAVGSNVGVFDRDHILECNFYCDTYGIDTISFGTGVAFIMECYENGIINKDITGGLELNFGNGEAVMELLHQIAGGEGFGKIAGQGIRKMKKIFVEQYGADPQFLEDIGMEAKGLEYSEYISKESLAQQAGYGMANKGAQHDEAWLIFMDTVLKQIPTFEDKAEALHFFPMFRTWFGLVGLCKLPWNDVVPADNADTDEPQKVPEHVENYLNLYNGVTGKEATIDDILFESEAVYNFQRVFNLKMGLGKREHDSIPYRSVGPVTIEEYESRQERYDNQLKELIGVDPSGKSTEEKIKIVREYREKQYEILVDTVYKRRGWTDQGIPTLDTLKRLRVDFPDVVGIVKKHL